jgi:hypothetical protein
MISLISTMLMILLLLRSKRKSVQGGGYLGDGRSLNN